MSGLTIEAVGDCHKGQVLIVGDCANQSCTSHYVACRNAPQPVVRVTRQTTIQQVEPKQPIQDKVAMPSLWWLFAIIVVVSIGSVTIAHILRKSEDCQK